MKTRAQLYADARAALSDLVKAEVACERASLARGELPAGTSRAKVTTANARWARKAEERDRRIGAACAAIRAAGLDSGGVS